MPRQKSPDSLGTTIPLRLSKQMQKTVSEGARKTGLSKQDLLRKSVEIGLPRFLDALDEMLKPSKAA